VLTFQIEIYRLDDEGELTPTNLDKKELKSKDVLLITDDKSKTLWLWKGSAINVRKKFLSAHAAVQLNSQKGRIFKSNAIEEGNEPEEFLNLFKIEKTRKSTSKKRSTSITKETKKSKYDSIPVIAEKVAPPIQETPPPQTPPKSKNLIKENKELPNELTLKIEEITVQLGDPPEGFNREYVIIGTDVYGVVVSKSTFLGTTTVDKSYQKIKDIKNGHFIAEGYLSRVLVKNNKVVAIEFIKECETKKEESISNEIKAIKKEMLPEKNIFRTEEEEDLVVYVNPLFE